MQKKFDIYMITKRLDAMDQSFDGINPLTDMNSLLYLRRSINAYGNTIMSWEFVESIGGIAEAIELLGKLTGKRLQVKELPDEFFCRRCVIVKTLNKSTKNEI